MEGRAICKRRCCHSSTADDLLLAGAKATASGEDFLDATYAADEDHQVAIGASVARAAVSPTVSPAIMNVKAGKERLTATTVDHPLQASRPTAKMARKRRSPTPDEDAIHQTVARDLVNRRSLAWDVMSIPISLAAFAVRKRESGTGPTVERDTTRPETETVHPDEVAANDGHEPPRLDVQNLKHPHGH